MYSIRLFAVRHARAFEALYKGFETVFLRLDPLFGAIGYNRLEKPVVFVERHLKGVLFDCKMCGQCILSSTGMSCPMNCPKNLRNGPCGGVRPGGFCEVKSEMRCVWVESWSGAAKMKYGAERIRVVQPPVNGSLQGSSSWLRAIREKAAQRRQAKQSTDHSKAAMADAFPLARKLEPVAAPLAHEPDNALAEQVVNESTTVFAAPDLKKER
jgi:hypothetical protein